MKISEMRALLCLRMLPPDEVDAVIDLVADEAIVAVAAPLALELGLRWLHDRANETVPNGHIVYECYHCGTRANFYVHP